LTKHKFGLKDFFIEMGKNIWILIRIFILIPVILLNNLFFYLTIITGTIRYFLRIDKKKFIVYKKEKIKKEKR